MIQWHLQLNFEQFFRARAFKGLFHFYNVTNSEIHHVMSNISTGNISSNKKWQKTENWISIILNYGTMMTFVEMNVDFNKDFIKNVLIRLIWGLMTKRAITYEFHQIAWVDRNRFFGLKWWFQVTSYNNYETVFESSRKPLTQ